MSNGGRKRRTTRFSAILNAEGVRKLEIHRWMYIVFGEHSMPRSLVLGWHMRFREGHVLLQDDAQLSQHPPYSPDLFP